MAKGDPPLTTLRKATRKLTEVQRNLAECSLALNGEADDLVLGCIALKEQIIKRWESLGGTYEPPANAVSAEPEGRRTLVTPDGAEPRPGGEGGRT